MDPQEGQEQIGQEAQGQTEITTDQPIGGQEVPSGGTGINPAWSEMLDALPSSLHSQVTPHLTKWDQNFQSKINEVHSQYEPYKPFLEQKTDPEQISYALSVLQAIEERPQEVMSALQQYMGIEEGQSAEQGQLNQQEDNGPSELPEYLNHPEFQRMKDMVDTMAQLLVQQRESESQAQEDSALEQELQQARETHGEYDEEWVLTKLYNNPEMGIDDAVKAYKDFENQIIQRNRQPGPPVLGAGGSVPNPNLSTKGLDGQGKRALVAQMLQQAAQQNQ